MSRPKKLPFWKDKRGAVGFNPRPGVKIDYGVVFDRERGHRVFFNYADTPALKNTWGVDSLRKWARQIELTDPEIRVWQEIIFQQCDLADKMNADWEAQGRPPEGVPEPAQTMN